MMFKSITIWRGGLRHRQIARQHKAARRGATMTETAIVLMVFLLLVFGMLDLGLMVARSHALSQAARSGTRAAIVRGEHAATLGSLGPSGLTTTAADSNAVSAAVRNQLVTMTPSSVNVLVTWPDGNNQVGSRVRVVVNADFTPIMTFIFGSPTWTLSGSSEMLIAH
jgi:Flp pilus assembly protein TadG